MGNKKKRKVKKEKKEPEYRTKEERQAEVKHILEQFMKERNSHAISVTTRPHR